MTADHEAAIRGATDALVAAILAAVRAEAATGASAPAPSWPNWKWMTNASSSRANSRAA